MAKKALCKEETARYQNSVAAARSGHAKSAVLISLSSVDAQRGYRHAIEEFIEYFSEPRPPFSKSVVLRYRTHLESRHLAPGTINPSLCASSVRLRGVRLCSRSLREVLLVW